MTVSSVGGIFLNLFSGVAFGQAVRFLLVYSGVLMAVVHPTRVVESPQFLGHLHMPSKSGPIDHQQTLIVC